MQIFKQIERFNLLDKLISQRRTGTPENLAQRLSLSVSRLSRIIEYLRNEGVPIQYDRSVQTYYYSVHYKMYIDVQMKELSDDEARSFDGGGLLRYGYNFFTLYENDRI